MSNRKSDVEVFDVAVVGGGASGCATAYNLAMAGASVVVLERHDLNTEASGRNAGSLHGQIQHEPFLEEGEEWARAWIPALRFLADSLEIWDGLSDELGTDLEVAKRGGILVADDPAQLPAIERKVAIENSAGIDSRMLSASEIRELAPWLTTDAVGGELCPIEGKANPLLVAPAFAQRATDRGAVLRAGSPVEGFREEGGLHYLRTPRGEVAARTVVLAGGDGMPALARHFGIDLPISSGAVQVSVTERMEPMVSHLVYYAGGKLTFKQAKAGTLLIGGGWPARQNAAGEWVVNPESLRANLAMAVRIAPSIADISLLRTWVGIGNGTPDHSPIIGAVPGRPRVILGFYPYMGFTAAPLMGRVLTDLVLERDPGRDLTPFAPDRF
ncbi:Sarcosine oxidase subunit beta [Microbacterium lemovicicum]|uniref:Sarcosine oxidase subunit beta n=1 Tax=Microbacterium lemovicicum TaxID=1072463 RepID=A0A3S9WCN9_9MICO|nr:FAD-dependent oxidoreductase [Microbacterium lemovicicum]AZS37845.1 Sarcosine oxidase subunit beta [Microbacterium lemovicicum]